MSKKRRGKKTKTIKNQNQKRNPTNHPNQVHTLKLSQTNIEEDEPSSHIAQRVLAKERKMSRPNGILLHSNRTNKSRQTPRSKETLGIPPSIETIQNGTTNPSRPIIC